MRTSARGTAAVALAVAALLTSGALAVADDDGPTQAQVDRAQAAVRDKARDVAAIRADLKAANQRLEDAAVQAEIASERYNGAQWRAQQAREEAVQARRTAKQAAARVAAQRDGIAMLVAQSYQDGTALNGVTAFLGSGGPVGVMERYAVAQSAGATMQAKYDEFARLSDKADAAATKARKAQARQQELLAEAAQFRDRATSAAAAAQREADGIEATRDQLITELARAQHVSVTLARQREEAREKARQEAAAAAAAAAAQAQAEAEAAAQAAQEAAQQQQEQEQDQQGSGSSPAPAPTPDPPAPSGGAAAAIAFAKAQLGEPYQWGADGPGSWDCSGLTMRAWQAGGVSLPHYSAAQYSETTHIGVGDLRPGDLVFWGSSPGSIHHVAMYIGNGQIIHAPRTGKPVQINSMYYWVPPDYFGRP